MIKNLALHLVISAGALMLLTLVFPDVIVDDWGVAFIAAAVFGLINVSIGPILKFFTLPIKWLTLGLFTFVINAVLLLIVDWFVDGMEIDGFGTAMFAAFVYSLVTWVAGLILIRDGD